MPVYWIVSPSLSGLNLCRVRQALLGDANVKMYPLLDGKFTRLSFDTYRLVDASVRTTADESNDFVSVKNADFACIAVVQG